MNPTSAIQTVQQTLLILLPELLILLTGTVMMTAGVFLRRARATWSGISAITLLVALVVLMAVRHHVPDVYSAVALNDAFSFDSRFFLLFTALIILAFAHNQVDDARAAEFFGALLMMDAGAMLVAASNELVFLFVGLELVSIPTYLLLYLPRRNATTQEAATKYFYLSILSSGLLLYGLAFYYGLTGLTNLKALAYVVAHQVPNVPQPQLAVVAILFIVAGLGFRVAAVPFHFYAPDVYQGSPTFMAAILAWVPKAIGFLALIRTLTAVLSVGGPSPVVDKALVLTWIIAVATMTLGNTVALIQDNLKRLFAYSSIAHAGYLMVGVCAALYYAPKADEAYYTGAEGILFYLFAYALMTLGAFGVIIMLSTPERPVETVDDFAGLGQTRPLTALAMAICLFSLAGIPPLAGFWGKFVVFASALGAASDENAKLFQWLAVIGVLNAAVGAYYYLRIVVVMYLRPANPNPRAALAPSPAWPTVAAVAACAGFTLLFGIFPAPIAGRARSAAIAASNLPEPDAPPVAVRDALRSNDQPSAP